MDFESLEAKETKAFVPMIDIPKDIVEEAHPVESPAAAPAAQEVTPKATGDNPVLIIRDQENREEIYDIPNGVTLIGRAPENDIILLESKISRRHARITREGSGCTLEDLGSSNGTWLNGERTPPHKPLPLHENDLLKIGQTIAWFKMSPNT
jgi:pSer/pThr/pTyr-binding forkhead associated (FHA) protein